MGSTQAPAPFWNLVSVALPIAAGVLGIAILSSNRRGGDYASALGGGILFLLGMAVVSVIGEAAAIAAMYRGERMLWLSVLGIVGNAAVFLPVLFTLLRAS